MSSSWTLYVVRVNGMGDFVNSSPCMDCTRILRMYNVKNIVYSDEYGHIQKMRFKDYIPKSVSIGRKYIDAGFSLDPKKKVMYSTQLTETTRSS